MENRSDQFPYYKVREFTAELDGRPLVVCSKPGISAWKEITPAAALLALEVRLSPQDQVLLSGSGHGAVAAALARQLEPGRLHILEDNHLALRLTAQTLRKNGLEGVHLHPSPAPDSQKQGLETGAFDVGVMELPKGRKLARRKMVEVYTRLRDGGVFYLAGPNQEGVQAVIKDAEALFGIKAATPGYKKGSRVARLIKFGRNAQQPAWAAEPGIAPDAWIEFTAEVGAEKLSLRSLPGVFSSAELDEGTRLLLEQLEPPEGLRVLDFGCGSGVIGVLLALRGAAQVDMVDISLLAVAAAKENLQLHNVKNAAVLPSDVLEAVSDREYDLIVSNPPFHSGKEVDYQSAETFIAHAARLLTPAGRLVLVANRFIRYDRLMEAHFKTVKILAETGKFHVLAGERQELRRLPAA